MIPSTDFHRPPSRQRKGTAFLMIVFMLLVIVVGCVELMIKQEVSDRRSLRQVRRANIMQSAIESVSQLNPKQEIILPISSAPSEQPSEEISLRFATETSSWTATWMREGKVFDSLSRTIASETNTPSSAEDQK